MSLAARIEAHWYRPRWYMHLWLAPLAWLFGLVGAVRRAGYRTGVFRSERLPVPVVVIGNINAGGVGKTPLTLALVEGLLAAGVRPGIITRGYGGHARHPVQVRPGTDPALCGDEPLLLAASGVPVVAGRDRVAAGRLLLETHPDVDLLLSDDGLQHYRLARDLEIVVIDGARGIGNGQLLPDGPLREKPSRLAGVDALVVNGPLKVRLPLPSRLPCFPMRLEPGRLQSLGQPVVWRDPQDFAGERVVAMAGIGHPRRFFETLAALGIRPERCLPFPDHHAFAASDIPEDADAVIVTAKDAVKMHDANRARLWVLPVSARVDGDLPGWILARLKNAHGR